MKDDRNASSSAASDPVAAFRVELGILADRLGVRLHESEYRPGEIHVSLAEAFPMWLVIELHPEDDRAFIFGVVRTTGLPGDRSDYHDLISAIWAIGLRALNIASVRMVDIPHPVVEGELYGRYIFFDKQPAVSFLSLRNPNFTRLEDVFWASYQCACFFSQIFAAAGGDHEIEEYLGDEGFEWAERVAKALRIKASHRDANYSRRSNPDWSYFRRNDYGLAAFDLGLELVQVLPPDLFADDTTVLRNSGGMFVRSDGINNYIPEDALNIIAKAIRVFDKQMSLPEEALRVNGSVALIPTESHLFCVASNGIFSLECECGHRQYVEQHASALRQLQASSRFLLSSVRFNWSGNLDEERFEQLMLDLVCREEGVLWARKVGHASASDAERDIEAIWFLGPASWQKASPDESPIQRHRVIVQCKAYDDAVNLSRIPDVPKILDFHDATGYLLIAYPRITPQVVDYFKNVPARRGFWADWWTQAEIEDRLRANMDITRRYPDLVTVSDQ